MHTKAAASSVPHLTASLCSVRCNTMKYKGAESSSSPEVAHHKSVCVYLHGWVATFPASPTLPPARRIHSLHWRCLTSNLFASGGTHPHGMLRLGYIDDDADRARCCQARSCILRSGHSAFPLGAKLAVSSRMVRVFDTLHSEPSGSPSLRTGSRPQQERDR